MSAAVGQNTLSGMERVRFVNSWSFSTTNLLQVAVMKRTGTVVVEVLESCRFATLIFSNKHVFNWVNSFLNVNPKGTKRCTSSTQIMESRFFAINPSINRIHRESTLTSACGDKNKSVVMLVLHDCERILSWR